MEVAAAGEVEAGAEAAAVEEAAVAEGAAAPTRAIPTAGPEGRPCATAAPAVPAGPRWGPEAPAAARRAADRAAASHPSPRWGNRLNEVNTFTGNLTISDQPVSYQGVGAALPFVISFNSQSSYSGPLGPQWTHSYDIHIVNQGATGAGVIEGDGHEYWFALVSGSYQPQASVFDTLAYSGGQWILTRPDRHVLYFSGARAGSPRSRTRMA